MPNPLNPTLTPKKGSNYGTNPFVPSCLPIFVIGDEVKRGKIYRKDFVLSMSEVKAKYSGFSKIFMSWNAQNVAVNVKPPQRWLIASMRNI